jgi:RIO kinase 1
MRVPERLEPLLDQGVIHRVLRPLMSGKEAQVFLVEAHGAVRVAKVYKEAIGRTFRQRVAYTEGRRVRGSREQRAIDRGSRFGKRQAEEAWRSAEVDAIYRLRAAGVRVPEPYDFVDGVLVMELVADEHGEPAPRLTDLDFGRREARELFEVLLTEVIKMLCAGLVHGDLSDFNILLGARGPVLIDFPQAVDSAANNLARKLLVRDVDNLVSFLGRFAPELRGKPYGREMWELYARNELRPDSVLTGRPPPDRRTAKANELMALLDELSDRTRAQRAESGDIRPARAPRVYVDAAPEPARAPRPAKKPRGPKPAPPPPPSDDLPDDLDALLIASEPKRRRR